MGTKQAILLFPTQFDTHTFSNDQKILSLIDFWCEAPHFDQIAKVCKEYGKFELLAY